jgi:HEAT repeat protein
MVPVAALLEDLLLLGDFDTALCLLTALEQAQQAGSAARHQAARTALDRLAVGPALGSMVAHLPTLDDAQFERLKAVCLAIGERLIPPLTEALAAEGLTRPRERLTAVLMAFGGSARHDLHRLKKSPNAATRRAAIRLFREAGRGDALADLGELLDDIDPHVQREAAVALLDTGGDRAYELLERTLSKSTERSRATIVQACVAARSEHSVGFFGHLLRHVDHRGESESLYLLSIEALGALGSTAGVPALKEALHRGEWWAPRRTNALRRAAATALARIGTHDALEVLREAMSSGPGGVRAAAREHAAAVGRGRTGAAS